MRNILFDEASGKIEAINEYTKATLKSFIGFIDNDFKSAIEEELEGETKRDVGYDFSEFKEKYKNEFIPESLALAEDFRNFVIQSYRDVILQHSPTAPVSVMVKNGKGLSKIFCLSKNGKQLRADLVYRNHPINPEINSALMTYLIGKGLKTTNKLESYLEVKSPDLTFDIVKDCFEKQYRLIRNELQQSELELN